MIKCVLLIYVSILVGCASPPPAKPPPLGVQIQNDSSLRDRLIGRVEPKITQKSDEEVLKYLRSICETLRVNNDALKLTPVHPHLLVDAKDGKWRNYSIPGIEIYSSIGLIRNFAYENELAASLSFEIAHVLSRHAAKKITSGVPLPEGLEFFDYTVPQLLESVRMAVNVLYVAGYDTRGLISLWNIYQLHPEKSPYSPELLQKLVDETYGAIVEYAPLRNPIVRSSDFIRIQKRINKL